MLPFLLLLLPSHNRSMSLLTKEEKRRLSAILFASTYFADAKHSQYGDKRKKTKQKGLGFRVSRKTLNPSAMIRVLSPLSSLFSSISPVLTILSVSCNTLFSLSLSLSLSLGFLHLGFFSSRSFSCTGCSNVKTWVLCFWDDFGDFWASFFLSDLIFVSLLLCGFFICEWWWCSR